MKRSPLMQPMRWLKGMMLRHMPMMITCREFEDFILAYLEGELPERQRRQFDLHIRLCRECRDYLAAYRLSTELAKRASERRTASRTAGHLLRLDHLCRVTRLLASTPATPACRLPTGLRITSARGWWRQSHELRL